MKVRVLSMVLGFAALQWVGILHSQVGPATPPPLNPEEIRRNAKEAQQELTRQFADFQKHLQLLKNRLDRSPNVEDKDRAAQLQKVLDQADSIGIRVKFARLNEHLAKEKFTTDDFREASRQTEELAKDLSDLVEIINNNNNRLAEEIAAYTKAIQALENIIKEEQRVQAITEQKKTDKAQTADLQRNVIDDTKDLRKVIDPNAKVDPKDPKSSQGNEAKKSETKDGKGEKKSEARDAGERKPGEAKDDGSKDAKVDPYDPKGKDKDKGEVKGTQKSDKQPGNTEAKEGEKKDSKGSENKDASAKDSKGSKDGSPKDNGPKGAPKDAKSGESKPGESKDAKKDGSDPKAKEAGEVKGADKQAPKNADNKSKDGKGENKDASAKDAKGSPKGGDPKGSPKDAKSGESKPGESKDAKKDGGDPKAKETGEAKKADKNADNKAKDGKGENKDASAKDAKGSKEGSPKDSGPKGSPKEAGAPMDPKGGDSKPGEAKDAKKDGGDPKAKETGEAKGADKNKQDPKKTDNTKEGDAKAKDNKGAEKNPDAKSKDNKQSPMSPGKNPDAKPSDSKDAPKDSKSGEAKSGEPKPGEKSEAKPGQPKDGGDPKDGDQSPKAKGDNQPKPPQDANEKDPPVGKKQVQDAIYEMEKAEKKIKEGKNDEAGVDQERAIAELKKAKKELEKRLKILREEELERLLANLKARCERMRAMQIGVLDGQPDGTKAIHRGIEGTSDKKATDAHVQASLKLATTEKEIINEANKMLEVLEGEGSAVAFPVAMQAVREDMKTVFRRLDQTNVGPFTQKIEQDIIDSLSDMIKALDKKKDDLDKEKQKEKDKKKKDQKDPGDKEQGPPPDQKLLDQIAELKMIRSMQVRLNDRTKLYANQEFPGKEQPPAAAEIIRREISELAERQERIFDITNKIQKGDNK